MGSDPQSHLEEQNFLIVGTRKIREDDWRRVATRIGLLKATMVDLGWDSNGSTVASTMLRECESIYLSMQSGTLASPPRESSTKVPSTDVAIAWAELQRKLNNVGTTLSLSAMDSIKVEVDRLRKILVAKGLL